MAGDKDEDWIQNELRKMKAETDRMMDELRELNSGDKTGSNNNNNSNPFSAFKNFVDSNVSSVRSVFQNVSSGFAEARAKMKREEEARREAQRVEEQDISYRWTGSRDTPDHIQMELSRTSPEEREDAYASTILLLNEAYQKNVHVPKDKIHGLFVDRQDLRSLRWLSVNWFKRSPYSPIRLEADPDLEDCGKNWRAAFEDLMDASLDKPMSSREFVGMREPYGKPQSTYYGPGLEWMLSLQCRGILPPLLPHTHNIIRIGSAGDNTEDMKTIHQTRSKLRWSHEYRGFGLEEDISDLMSEVATKSTSDTYAVPLDIPKTEQDMYESSYIMPQGPTLQIKGVADAQYQTDDEEDGEDDERGSTEDRRMGILEEMERLLDGRHLAGFPFGASQSLAELFQKVLDGDIDPLQEIKSESPEQKRQKEQLIERAKQLGAEVSDMWSLLPNLILDAAVEQLEKESREEEWENLREMTGEKRQMPPASPEKPSVLSALTTTRTTRLPDGTVTTEVVLKKRFSDGTETSEESVHTSNEALERQHREEHQQEDESPKKKGWFWT